MQDFGFQCSQLLHHFVSECVEKSLTKEEVEEGEGRGEEKMESLKSSMVTLAQSLDAKLGETPGN